MRPIAESIASALEAIGDIDTSDVSSLAYASSLFAIEMMLPNVIPDEIDFNVSVSEGKLLMVESENIHADHDVRAAINTIATHYFQSIRMNLPLCVH